MHSQGTEQKPTYSLDDIRNLKSDLARATPEAVTETSVEPGSVSLLLSLFRPLLNLCQTADSIQIRAAACDALSTWLNKACKLVDTSSTLSQEVLQALDVATLTSIYNLMLSDWDLGVPMHGPLRAIFSRTLLLHKKIRLLYSVEVEEMLSGMLQLDHSRKSVYYAIELVRKSAGIAIIRKCDPQFFHKRLSCMQDTSIATPLGRLLSSYMIDLLPKSPTMEHQLSWLSNWQAPIARSLLDGNQVLVSNILTYLLPQIFQKSEVAFFKFTEDIASNTVLPESPGRIHIIMSCLSLAKDVGLIEDVDSGTLQRLGLLEGTLRDLLMHKNSLLRISALKVVLLHPKTTTPYPPDTYKLLQATLSYQFRENDMHFRKDIMDCIRSFLLRFQSSLHNTQPLLRKAEKTHDKAQCNALLKYIDNSHQFALWLIAFLRANLHPGTGYQVTYMSLQTLYLMTGLGWFFTESAICEKFAAFRLTKSSNKNTGNSLPFKLDPFNSEMIRLLLDRLSDSFDDNRSLAISILSAVPLPLAGLDTSKHVWDLYRNADELQRSPRERDGNGGARLIQFLYQKFICSRQMSTLSITSAPRDTVTIPEIQFLEDVLHRIDLDVHLASNDILEAALERPIHGRISALCYMLGTTDLYKTALNSDIEFAWKRLHNHIIDSSHRIWNTIREVLCDDSPEGSLPLAIQRTQQTPLRSSDTQVILSFCWRALREVSNLLRVMLVSAPYNSKQSLLNEEDFSHAGELFLAWLTEVRHRGAFSAVFPNFIDICKRLLNMEAGEIAHKLPRSWLESNIMQLRAPSHSKDITRRSGGLPMSVISLMISEIETDSASRAMIGFTFKELIDLVTLPLDLIDEQTAEHPQVHGLNTLKDIFLESRLATCSMDYLEACLIIAIDGFSSGVWAIRNCSLMLFSAILRRAFGSKLSRTEAMSRPFSARAFFGRYPKVLTRLNNELQTAVAALFREELPIATTALHPCLTLLSRLSYADSDDSEDYENFEQLLGLLTVISTSKIWQIRSMAAQAVPTFVEPELVASFVVQQLNQATTADQNALHGRLLMIYHVLRYNLDLHCTELTYVDAVLDDVRRLITAKLAAFSSENTCAVTETVWLRILLFLARTSRADLNVPLRQRVVDYCARQLADQSKLHDDIGGAGLLEIMTTINLRILAPNTNWLQPRPAVSVIRGLLTDVRVSVRLQVYNSLLDMFHDSAILKSSSLRYTLEKQSIEETWSVARIAARRCLARLPPGVERRDPDTIRTLTQRYLLDLEAEQDENPDIAFTLMIIGTLIGESQIHEPRFISLTRRFVRDEVPFETRKAVLRALVSSKVLDPLKKTRLVSNADAMEHALVYVPTVWMLLTDDEEDIRKDTALFVGKDILSSLDWTPEKSKEDLIDYLISTSPKSERLQDELIGHLGLSIDLTEALSGALHPSEMLFAVEKQNLWRNPVTDANSALRGLSALTLTTSSASRLRDIAAAGMNAILIQIRGQHVDGPLGWTSIPEVWQLMVRVLQVSHWLISSAQTDAATKDMLKKQMSSLLKESASLDLHPSLLRMIDANFA